MQGMDRMRSGQWYLPGGPEADAAHARCFALTREFNQLGNTDPERAQAMLRELFPHGEVPEIWGPVHVEFTILDIAEVAVGARTLFGPGCRLITVGHPVDDHRMRAEGWEIAKP